MLKRTTSEVTEHFAKFNCKLLGEYTGTKKKMEYICSCGNKSEISWNKFTQGQRCGLCKKWGNKHKKSLEEIKLLFHERGCEFLDDFYKGIHTKHNYKCKCGKKSQITFAAFHWQNQYCLECGKEKNKGENHHSWKSDREKHELERLFRKKMYKALRTCFTRFNKEKNTKSIKILGYSPTELYLHITSHTNWEKVKDTKWTIDHIFPIQAFIDFNIWRPDLINCLENLQPMESKANTAKSDKYDVKEFENWLLSKKICFDKSITLE
jgi:hypothetical protein